MKRIIVLLLLLATAAATPFVWTGAGDGVTWEVDANWDQPGFPSTDGDTTTIAAGAAAIVTIAPVTVGEVNMEAGFSGSVTLGAAFSITDVGGQNGQLTIAGGILDANGFGVSTEAKTEINGGTFIGGIGDHQFGASDYAADRGLYVVGAGSVFDGGSGTHTISSMSLHTGTITLTSGVTDINYKTTSGCNGCALMVTGQSFDDADGTVKFSYADTQLLYTSNPAATVTFYNVIIDKGADNVLEYYSGSGFPTAVDNDLTITSGTFKTQDSGGGVSRDLTISAKTTLYGPLNTNDAIISLGSGYTTTTALEIYSGGQLNGGSGAHTYGSVRVFAGGLWSATSGTTTLDSHGHGTSVIAFDAGSTFTHNSGTVEITDPNIGSMRYYSEDDRTFYNLIYNSPKTLNWVLGSPPNSIIVENDLTILQGGIDPSFPGWQTGNIEVQGATLLNGGYLMCYGCTMDTLTMSSGTFTLKSGETLEITKATGDVQILVDGGNFVVEQGDGSNPTEIYYSAGIGASYHNIVWTSGELRLNGGSGTNEHILIRHQNHPANDNYGNVDASGLTGSFTMEYVQVQNGHAIFRHKGSNTEYTLTGCSIVDSATYGVVYSGGGNDAIIEIVDSDLTNAGIGISAASNGRYIRIYADNTLFPANVIEQGAVNLYGPIVSKNHNQVAGDYRIWGAQAGSYTISYLDANYHPTATDNVLAVDEGYGAVNLNFDVATEMLSLTLQSDNTIFTPSDLSSGSIDVQTGSTLTINGGTVAARGGSITEDGTISISLGSLDQQWLAEVNVLGVGEPLDAATVTFTDVEATPTVDTTDANGDLDLWFSEWLRTSGGTTTLAPYDIAVDKVGYTSDSTSNAMTANAVINFDLNAEGDTVNVANTVDFFEFGGMYNLKSDQTGFYTIADISAANAEASCGHALPADFTASYAIELTCPGGETEIFIEMVSLETLEWLHCEGGIWVYRTGGTGAILPSCSAVVAGGSASSGGTVYTAPALEMLDIFVLLALAVVVAIGVLYRKR